MAVTVKEIAEDLSLANEMGESYGYAYLDENTILVEEYDEEGEIATKTKMHITFEEVTDAD